MRIPAICNDVNLSMLVKMPLRDLPHSANKLILNIFKLKTINNKTSSRSTSAARSMSHPLRRRTPHHIMGKTLGHMSGSFANHKEISAFLGAAHTL